MKCFRQKNVFLQADADTSVSHVHPELYSAVAAGGCAVQ